MSRNTDTAERTPQTETDRSTDDDGVTLSRRSAMAGIGGMLGASLVAAGPGSADVDPDVHTRQTYRAVVDAIVPRTPDRGGVHAPGALDIGLEEFVIFQLDFGNTVPVKQRQPAGLQDRWEQTYDAESNDLERYLAGVEQGAGFSIPDDLGMARDDVFGALEGLSVEIEPSGDVVHSVTTTGGQTTTRTREELPIAALYAATLDLYALFLIVGGGTRGPIQPRQKFRGGGLYTFLSPVDRMQCLLFITTDDGQDLDAAGTAFLPGTLTAKKLVGTTLTSALVGYYTEWQAYGSTRTDDPNDREVQLPLDGVQGWQQVGYDGPVEGRAGYFDGPVDEFAENDWGDGT